MGNWKWEEDGYTVYRGTARTAPGCHDSCGVLMYVKDGKIEKVEGDPDDPFNEGRLCMRCLALKDVIYHKDRLLYPMKRAKADRGKDKFERITWDEAYDIVVSELNKVKEHYGPEAVIFTQGTGRDSQGPSGHLAYSFGSPNWFIGFLSGAACYMPRMSAQSVVVGGPMVADCGQYRPARFEDPEYVLPEYMIIWGNNPIVANADGFFGHWVVDLKKAGTKFIVVDPRLTWLASRAEYWLQLRPGTDDALALGMLNVIIGENLYDHDFVERWCYGFDKLAERAAEYPPERVAEICWLDADDIRGAARAFAEASPASIQWGVGIDHAKNGVAAAQGILALVAVTGNVDRPGGQVYMGSLYGIVGPQWCGGWGYDLLSPEMQAKRLGVSKYPMYDFGLLIASSEEVLSAIEDGVPYPVRAAFMQANNAITCMGADAQRVLRALNSLDFVACADLFMTPTIMACADVVLPVCTFAERIGYAGYAGTAFTPITKAIEPVGESKSDWLMMMELGKRFNPDAVPWDTEEEMYDDILSGAGMSFGDLLEAGYVYPPYEYYKYEKGLMRGGEPGFPTETGRIELYSLPMARWGLDPLPFAEEPPESPVSTPELFEKYPFVLTTGARHWSYFHSEHRQIKSLRTFYSEPHVEINADVAAKLGIKDEDWVRIENAHGSCRQKARLVDTIHPQVVAADHAWWFPEGDPEDLFGMFDVNINQLIPAGECGDTGFGAPYKSSLCAISRIEEGE